MTDSGYRFTGKQFAFWFFGIFGLVFAVNIFMVVMAQQSWPGLVTENAYDESQVFNEQRAAQEALGWDASVSYENGEIILDVVGQDGKPVSPTSIDVKVGRPATDREDAELSMRFNGQDFVAERELGKGQWRVFLKMNAPDGTLFQQTQDIWVD